MKNKIIAVMLMFSFVIGLTPVAFATAGAGKYAIHLSPHGSDENDGTKENPVKTFEKARDIYRELREADENFEAEILVHGGIYRLSKSFTLNEQDRGLKITAYGDGEVSVRGSVKLSKGLFKKTTDEEFLALIPENAVGKIYEYDLSEVLQAVEKHPEYKGLTGGTAYYELFVNGELQTIARWPNHGYALTGNASGNSFRSDSERLSKWKNSKYGMVRGYWYYDWAMEHAYITDVDVENSKVSFEKELEFSNGIRSGKRYYAMNMPEEMDIPGEYYIDCDEKKLYYYPSEDFLLHSPELSVMKSALFSLNGASDVEISGITFENVRGQAMTVSNGSNITIDSCVFKNIGNRAVSISTSESVVKNCELYNLGGGGISVSAGDKYTLTRGNTKITNNNIYNFGRTFRTYQAGIIVGGVGNEITYNTIHDTPHMGVTLGGNDNVVSYNEVYNIVFECSDSGGMYTGRNWTSWGNVVSYNYLHDIKKDESLSDHTVSAVYLDDMMTGFVVKNNIFENCTQAVLMGGGRANFFTDNIIVDCEKGIAYDDRAVTGNWAADSVVSGGTVYESVLEFLDKIDVEVWKEKYHGFSNMLADLESYKNDQTHEMGYPEDAVITGNKHYGENAGNEGYDNISEYVYEYGTVSDNIHSKEKGEYTVPETGADKFLWDNDFKVYFPGNEEVFEKGDVEFVWSRAGGADYYETVVTNEKGEEVFKSKSLYNGAVAKILEKGHYNWKITASGKGESVTKEGSFEVKKDYYQAGTFFGGTDFEDTSLESLKKEGWSFLVAEGDSITLEIDETGNSYIEMVRSENNFLSGAETSAKMKFKEKETGKITVTYDIMLENYRGGWRDMGSVQNPNGGDVMRLLTHSNWVYGMATDSKRFNFSLNTRPKDSYITVKRVIDLDNDTYSIDIYQNGQRIGGSSNKACNNGVAENIMFRLQYQSPFEASQGEGDAVYRIDNISVDMGEISPSKTFPEDDDYNVAVDSEIKVKWNSTVNSETVNKNTVFLYENGELVSDYNVLADEKNIQITPTDGLNYGSEYKVIISENVKPDSLTHSEMTEDYEFSFKTKEDLISGENDLKITETKPENNSVTETVNKIDLIFNFNPDPETVTKSNVKLYKYSHLISEYSLSVSGNVISVIPDNTIEKGAECSVLVTTGVLPENRDEVNPMKEDYSFSFRVGNESAEKKIIGYDFEDWDGFSLKGPIETSYKGWNFVLYEGDSVAVETDSLTGSKALKLTKGSQNSMMKVYMDYDLSGDELIKVRFDTYLENQSRRIHDWGTNLSKDNKTFLKMVVYGSGYWHRQIGDTKRWLCGLGNTPTTVEQIMNAKGYEYTVNIYRNGSQHVTKSESSNSKVLPGRLYFAVNNQQDDYKGSADGDGIYWIDNVTVSEIYTPKVESITSDYLKTAEIRFNRNINPETAIKSNIKVYEDGVLKDFNIISSDERAIKIEFEDKLLKGRNYCFEIDGILAENGTKMISTYTGGFECPEVFEVLSIGKEDKNTVINLKTNLEKFICLAVKKGSEGRLSKCEILEGSETITHIYDENTEYLFWDSLDGMRPLK